METSNRVWFLGTAVVAAVGCVVALFVAADPNPEVGTPAEVQRTASAVGPERGVLERESKAVALPSPPALPFVRGAAAAEQELSAPKATRATLRGLLLGARERRAHSVTFVPRLGAGVEAFALPLGDRAWNAPFVFSGDDGSWTFDAVEAGPHLLRVNPINWFWAVDVDHSTEEIGLDVSYRSCRYFVSRLVDANGDTLRNVSSVTQLWVACGDLADQVRRGEIVHESWGESAPHPSASPLQADDGVLGGAFVPGALVQFRVVLNVDDRFECLVDVPTDIEDYTILIEAPDFSRTFSVDLMARGVPAPMPESWWDEVTLDVASNPGIEVVQSFALGVDGISRMTYGVSGTAGDVTLRLPPEGVVGGLEVDIPRDQVGPVVVEMRRNR